MLSLLRLAYTVINFAYIEISRKVIDSQYRFFLKVLLSARVIRMVKMSLRIGVLFIRNARVWRVQPYSKLFKPTYEFGTNNAIWRLTRIFFFYFRRGL